MSACWICTRARTCTRYADRGLTGSAGETCLALPKLNLQFLTAHDYLLRNFDLFRLEATYEIREDLADVLSRVQAVWCAAAAAPSRVSRYLRACMNDDAQQHICSAGLLDAHPISMMAALRVV